jgi:hypothetical protein
VGLVLVDDNSRGVRGRKRDVELSLGSVVEERRGDRYGRHLEDFELDASDAIGLEPNL